MEHRATLEVIAPTVPEAIEKGLVELGLEDTQVDVEVLDEGGTGFLGIGGRQARIRLTVRDAAAKQGSPRKSSPRRTGPQVQPGEAPDPEQQLSITKATVEELLDHLGVNAQVSVHLAEPDEPDMPAPVMVSVEGGDLSFLIGHHAETLNALQLITRMMVGKELGSAAHVIIDVAGYRARREENLRSLAQKMAKQAVSSGRRQTLEPMTPAERRIIHLELRDSSEVTTESVGEEPRRKVVVIPR
jgi:spoIIIJ-associated protein